MVVIEDAAVSSEGMVVGRVEAAEAVACRGRDDAIGNARMRSSAVKIERTSVINILVEAHAARANARAVRAHGGDGLDFAV